MSYRHLTQEERYQIAALLSAGLSNVAIARQLGRHPSTIGRERRRNTGERSYRAASAHKAAQTRRHHASSRPQLPAEAFAQIEHGVSQQWSPVQIRGRCQLLGMAVPSHTTIYRYIHRHGLRHRLRLPKRRRGYGRHRVQRFADRTPISERPQAVQDMTQFGHWEVDTVRPGKGSGVLVTMNERLSGLLCLGWSPTGKAEDVADTVAACLMPYRTHVHTLTSDRGSEFADGDFIELALETTLYMADPHAPWQRARNEHLNGLVREYFPRKRNFSTILPEEIRNAQDALNNRPRKRHRFLTPFEVFFHHSRVALRG